MKTKSAAEIDVGDGGGGVRFAMVASTLRRPFRDDFPTYVEGMCRSRPGRFLAPPEFARNARLVRDFQPRRDDIYVMTFPKSGTSLSLSLFPHCFLSCFLQLGFHWLSAVRLDLLWLGLVSLA